MFDSIKYWLSSLNESNQLFDHPNDEVLHSALASVIYHLIAADKTVSNKEKQMFAQFLSKECELSDVQIDHLYDVARASAGDVSKDLSTVAHYLKDNPGIRKEFMARLLAIIDIDGTRDEELAFFYEVLHEIFPDVKPIA